MSRPKWMLREVGMHKERAVYLDQTPLPGDRVVYGDRYEQVEVLYREFSEHHTPVLVVRRAYG